MNRNIENSDNRFMYEKNQLEEPTVQTGAHRSMPPTGLDAQACTEVGTISPGHLGIINKKKISMNVDINSIFSISFGYSPSEMDV